MHHPAQSLHSITRQSVRLQLSFSILRKIISLLALGKALATLGRPLVYGGGSRGIMGIISSAVLSHGGSVTGIVPAAMLRAGGEGDPTTGGHIDLVEEGNKKVRLSHHIMPTSSHAPRI